MTKGGNYMLLVKNSFPWSYICDLTKQLNALSGISDDAFGKHYIYANEKCYQDRFFYIRIAGGSIGAIWTDDDFVVTKIVLDTAVSYNKYPKNIDDILSLYIGKRLTIPKCKENYWM